MFIYNIWFQYMVCVGVLNFGFVNLLFEQFGGLQGEFVVVMCYFMQVIIEEDLGCKDMFFDIVIEELSYFEVIGLMVVMFNCGVKGELVEVVDEQVELYCKLYGVGNDSYVMQVLYGVGVLLINLGGVLWLVVYIDMIGELIVDLCLNIVVEVCVKIIYEWLINVIDDLDICDVFGFLMMCEVLYQMLFEKVLYVIIVNFLLGKLLFKMLYDYVYFWMQLDVVLLVGLWNYGGEFEIWFGELVVDGGSGILEGMFDVQQVDVIEVMVQ